MTQLCGSTTQLYWNFHQFPHFTSSLPVALQGRTPVKLIGSVKKGERLVSAGQPGYAMALKEDKYYDPRIVIGRSLEDTDGDTVMAVIGVK